MENNLPLDAFRPEDEYPDLGAQPIEAAEPVIPEEVPDEEPTEEIAPAEPAEETVPEAVIPTAEDTAAEPVPPTQDQPIQAYPPQNGIPYMTYPMYPPIPGMPLYPQQPGQPYPPQQAYPQQPYPQQFPQQGMFFPNYNYAQYYAPYPPQPPVQPPTLQPAPPVQPQNTEPYPAQQSPAAQNTTPQNAPYAPQDNTPFIVPEEKKPVSTGTKAFLIVLTALLIAMVAGFIVFVANIANKSDAKNEKDPFGISEEGDLLDNFIDNESGELKHSEVKESITLVADDGATQVRDTDNPDSIGKPDKNAKGITLKDVPKDADDDSKYTAKRSFNTLADSVVTISCYEDKITENVYDIKSSGSGVIISADGYVITNAHVLGNSKQYAVNVILNSGKAYQAKIIGYDTWTDLAVLKIDATGLKPAEFGDSESVEVGDDVIAIGSPGGAKYQNSLTQGVISAVDREISVNKCVRYIQSDAAINPGSSGGPLCNLCGQVIGITTAKTIAENYENMSFSIPSAIVKDIVTDLIRYGYVPDRTRIGFSGSEVSADEKLYYSMPAGVIVGEIAEDGALKGSGVKEGDVITAIDGEAVGSFQDIYNILAKHKVGDKVELSIYRIEEEGFFDTEEPTVVAK